MVDRNGTTGGEKVLICAGVCCFLTMFGCCCFTPCVAAPIIAGIDGAAPGVADGANQLAQNPPNLVNHAEPVPQAQVVEQV